MQGSTGLVEKIDTDFRTICNGQPYSDCHYVPFRPKCKKCTIAFTLDYLAEHSYLKEHPDKNES